MDFTKLVQQAYKIIGRGEKLRPEAIEDALTALERMFSSWANRGTTTWRLATEQISIPAPTLVENEDDDRFVCIRRHRAAADNEPGEGDNSAVYWLESTDTISSSTEWAEDSYYDAASNITLSDTNMFGVAVARVIYDGEISSLKFISRKRFAELDPKDTGRPKYAVFHPLTGLNLPMISIWPFPVGADYALELVKVLFVPDATSVLSSPQAWDNTVLYGLAVELGYLNGIPMDVLTGIVEKFKFEFQKAKGADREVETSCFVDPVY